MTSAFNDTRVPVTLLTGFLGAGKTTLLNHLIRDPGAGRVAVIMNEFGDIGLDHDLIEEATEETVLLQSGCLCCSILGDLSKTLRALRFRRAEGQVDFDRVVIETSGIAEPGPILHSMIVDGAVASAYRMDGVVTLADTATGPQTLDTQFESVQQIAMADLIILTKTDRVTEPEIARYESRLQGINPSARRVRADHGHVPPGTLFGLSATRGGVASGEVMDWLGTDAPTPDPLAGLSGFAPKPSTGGGAPLSGGFVNVGVTAGGHHDHRIVSASIEIDTPLQASVFDFWLDTLIALRGPKILRMKGIVHVEGMEWPFVLHGVQHIFDPPMPLKSWAGRDATSRIVVIARDMDERELTASFETLRMRRDDTGDEDGMMVRSADMPLCSWRLGLARNAQSGCVFGALRIAWRSRPPICQAPKGSFYPCSRPKPPEVGA